MEGSAAYSVTNMNMDNEEYFCECKEQINAQSQLIETLIARIEDLEADFIAKDEDIEKLKQDFQSIRNNTKFNKGQEREREGHLFYKMRKIHLLNEAKAKAIAEQAEAAEKVHRHRPTPLDLSRITSTSVIRLGGVRMIDDLSSVQYPPHIIPPNPALNYNAEPRKFKYDREFMMQFVGICLARPENLDPFEAIHTFHIKDNEKKTSRIRTRKPDELKKSDERINRTSSTTSIYESPEKISIESCIPKVKALLNKLSLERFDSISNQIIEYVNSSKDGHILKEVTHLIIEMFPLGYCAIYAQLCHRMMGRIDPEIMDENAKNSEGKCIKGGSLFRKYLLNRCQEGFEKGWKDNIPASTDERREPGPMPVVAKRQGLRLIRFIGELFKLNMVTERIVHECIKKLLIFQDLPDEEEMGSLCELMSAVGERLDHVKTSTNSHLKVNPIDDAKAKRLMDAYFDRMEEITKLPNLSNRIKSMIMNVIDLRNNAWEPRRSSNVPKTTAEIHEEDVKQKENAEFYQRRKRKDKKGIVDDLSKFGVINRGKITGNISLAPRGLLVG